MFRFRPILKSLFSIRDCTWLSVKTKCCMIELEKRVFKRACLHQMKVRRWTLYCHKTEWIPVDFWAPVCSNCKRIRTTRLTLDGLRLQRLKKFVDKNEEARLIRLFYYTPIRRRLELM